MMVKVLLFAVHMIYLFCNAYMLSDIYGSEIVNKIDVGVSCGGRNLNDLAYASSDMSSWSQRVDWSAVLAATYSDSQLLREMVACFFGCPGVGVGLEYI